MTSKVYTENEAIVKDVIFEFVSLYGPSNTWNKEITELMNEEVKRRIEEQE